MRKNIKIERSEEGYFASIDGKSITDAVPKSSLNEAIDAYLGADKNKNGATTVKEIKARLDELGVDYPSSETKTELAKRLTEAELNGARG